MPRNRSEGSALPEHAAVMAYAGTCRACLRERTPSHAIARLTAWGRLNIHWKLRLSRGPGYSILVIEGYYERLDDDAWEQLPKDMRDWLGAEYELNHRFHPGRPS